MKGNFFLTPNLPAYREKDGFKKTKNFLNRLVRILTLHLHKPDKLMMTAINSCLVLASFNICKNYQEKFGWKKHKVHNIPIYHNIQYIKSNVNCYVLHCSLTTKLISKSIQNLHQRNPRIHMHVHVHAHTHIQN